MEYYSAIKNELQIDTTTWKNLKCIILCENSQIQRIA